MPQTDLPTLRASAAQDAELLKIQMARLDELRRMDPKDMKSSDRNQIINWSRSSTTEYNIQLEQMEAIPKPSVEEKEVMRELNKLVMLGDELVARTRELRDELNAKSKALKAKEKEAAVEKLNEKSLVEPVEDLPSQRPEVKSRLEERATPEIGGVEERKMLEGESSGSDYELVSSSGSLSPVEVDEDDEEEIEAEQIDFSDPKDVYALLGLAPSASMAEIRSAIRKKKMTLHPDRNPTNPNATEDFAKFDLLCKECFGDETKRKEYDDIQTMEQLEDLSERVRELTTGGTWAA